MNGESGLLGYAPERYAYPKPLKQCAKRILFPIFAQLLCHNDERIHIHYRNAF